ncbi:MAG: hypothetical protein ABI743_00465 [bacterium]
MAPLHPPGPPALVALDPGTRKVGVCVLDARGTVLERAVVTPATVATLLERYATLPLAVGRGTGVLDLPPDRLILWVDESGSTAEGRARWRKRYPLLAFFEVFGYNPPSDAWAAEVIGLRALSELPFR